MVNGMAAEGEKVGKYIEKLADSERLFIADSAKHRVVSALISYFTENKTESFLAITPETVTAAELATCLEHCFGKIFVVDTVQKMDSLFEGAGIVNINDCAGIDKNFIAKIIKKNYPYLIIALEDYSGTPILNKEFFADVSLDGSIRRYSDRRLQYALADLMADAEYDFVYMDEVYGLFELKKCKNTGKYSVDTIDPFEYDVMFFNSEVYYTPRIRSYKRLAKIADSAGRVVVYSDCLTAGAGVNLYLAKKLTDNLGLNKLAKKIADILTAQNSDVLQYTLNTALENEGIADYVMSFAGSRFSDVGALAKRISDMFGFMTQRELFLQTVRAYVKMRGTALSEDYWFDNMLDFITDGGRNFARLVYNVLLSDKTEVRAVEAHKAEEIAELMESFGGIAYPLSATDFEVVRVKRLDSFFGYILDKRHGSVPKRDNETVFTSVEQNDCRFNKYLAVFKAISAEKGGRKPFIIVVSREAMDEAVTSIRKLSEKFGYRYMDSVDEIMGDSLSDGAVVAVTDIPHFAATPYDYAVRAIYFADLHPADRFFAGLMDKAKSMRFAPRIILMAMRDDFSGNISEKYINKSCDLSEVTDKSENMSGEYASRVKKLEAVYIATRMAVENSLSEEDVAAAFTNELSGINTQNVFFSPEAKFRLSQMKHIGKCFGMVIGSSVTIEEGGDSVENIDPPPIGKSGFRKVIPVGARSGDSRYVFFGACIKYLRGMCPPPANCADCPKYEKLKVNNPRQFFRGVNNFYSAINEYVEEYRKLVENRSAGRSIHSASADEVFEKSMLETKATINKSERAAKSIIASIKSEEAVAAKEMFRVEYDKIEGIRCAMYDVFIKAFGDFFNVTENMMSADDVGFGSINE